MKYGAVRKFYPRKLPKGKEVKEQGNFSALPATVYSNYYRDYVRAVLFCDV